MGRPGCQTPARIINRTSAPNRIQRLAALTGAATLNATPRSDRTTATLQPGTRTRLTPAASRAAPTLRFRLMVPRLHAAARGRTTSPEEGLGLQRVRQEVIGSGEELDSESGRYPETPIETIGAIGEVTVYCQSQAASQEQAEGRGSSRARRQRPPRQHEQKSAACKLEGGLSRESSCAEQYRRGPESQVPGFHCGLGIGLCRGQQEQRRPGGQNDGDAGWRVAGVRAHGRVSRARSRRPEAGSSLDRILSLTTAGGGPLAVDPFCCPH